MLVVVTSIWIVIIKTIEIVIPQRGEHRDEQRLGKRNPDIVYHQIPAGEIAESEIGGLLNRRRMFAGMSNRFLLSDDSYCARNPPSTTNSVPVR